SPGRTATGCAPRARSEPLALFVRSLPLADVHQERLGVQRLSRRIFDRRGLLTDPDDPPFPGDEAVITPELTAVTGSALVRRKNSLAVIGMQKPRKQLWLRAPFLGGVTEHRLDMGTDVQAGAAVTGKGEPSQEGEP